MAPTDPVHALIVDDDRSIQRMLADALSAEGFWVTVERDGEWAVKTFTQKRFDVVLLDLLLPALNGYEAARQMKALPKGARTPILLLSGVYKSALHKREAVEKHGAFAFLEKPLKLSRVLKTLKEALGDRYPQRAVASSDEPSQSDPYADPQAEEEGQAVEATSRTSNPFHSLRGEFARKPFPELLAEIHRWSGTGALLLRREQMKKIVYFRNGECISVRSNLMSECLGRVMVHERMISEAECEESLRRMKGSGRLQGTVLIEMGCISPHNLSYALNLQLRFKLLELFAWETGEYQFNPKAELPQATVQLDMPTAEIIYEGIRRSFTPERLQRIMAPLEALFVRRSENPLFAFQDMGIGEEELNLLRAANGSRSVAQLRERNYLSPEDTHRFLYALTCAQMVELCEEAGPEVGASRALGFPVEEISGSELVPLDPPPLAAPATSVAPSEASSEFDLSDMFADAAGEPLPTGDELLPEISYAPTVQAHGEGAVREKLLGKLAEMRRMDYFEVLGIRRDAPPEKIKRAYFQLAREYHPDKHHRSASSEVRQLAQQVLEVISTAHDTLASAEERTRYLEELRRGVRRETLPDISRLLTAEQHFRKGLDRFQKDRLKEALEHFTEAVKLSGKEGEFRAYLGWTLFLCEPGDPVTADAALTELERAVELNPTLDRAYLFRGYVYKAQGRPDKAERQFEKAIECNADCVEALHELSVLTSAGQPNRTKR